MIGTSALLLVMLISGATAVGAQEATPAAGMPRTATEVCNQAMLAATPVAETAELPVDASFDLAFIDLMTVHHQRAIDMAAIAIERGEHLELIALAQRTVDTLQAQIDQLKTWRELWYPGIPALTGSQAMAIFDQVASESPGRGGVPGARELTSPPDIMGLCGANPGEFDLAFIDRMTSYHAGALLLTQAAVNFAEHGEIQNFAASTLAALQTDVDALNAWRSLWFPDALPVDVD
jgi:uncharacterized protein (DUF305 family)